MEDRGHVADGNEQDNVSGGYDNQGMSSPEGQSPRRSLDRDGHRHVTIQFSDEPPADYDRRGSTAAEAFSEIDQHDARGGYDIQHHNLNGVERTGERYHHHLNDHNMNGLGSANERHDRHHHQQPVDSIELDIMEDGRSRTFHRLHSTGSGAAGDHDWTRTHLRHRRAKSQHVNGYEFYKQMQRQASPRDQDNQSVHSLNFEDLRETRNILATIRIRRKSRKKLGSSRRSTPRGDGAGVLNDDVDIDNDEEEYEEEVGMPSSRHKMKSLTERLHQARQMSSTSEVARQFRGLVGAKDRGDRTLSQYPRVLLKKIRSFRETLSFILHRINFWSQQFKEIEGHFGIATTTYFRFTRWLVKINFLVFFLFLCFIYIPQLTYNSIFKQMDDTNIRYTNSSDVYTNRMFECTDSYNKHVENVTEQGYGWKVFLEIAQGTGVMENTMLFYGYYSNLTFWVPTLDILESNYNMGLGYLLTVGISFIVLFIMIVRNSSQIIEEAVIDFDNKAFPRYCNAVFGGWDFCINSEKMAFFKHKIIYNEFKANLEEIQSKRRRENRTTREKTRLYLKRTIISLIVISFLCGSFFAIYRTVEFLLEMQQKNLSPFVHLLVGYLPSIVISILNVVVPEIFLALSKVEEYTHSFATHITIVRAVVLRLSSVWVLIVSLYIRLHARSRSPYSCPEEEVYNATIHRCCGNMLWQSSIEGDMSGKGAVKCWETYVGQQFYKLGITDFVSVTMVVFFIKIPRRIIHHHLKNKVWIVAKIGRAKFDLPLQVLDIVYSQTLCWTGMFFSPLLPAITFVKVFFFFFLKKFELLNVTESPENAYRASRSYSFFQTVLLVSFIAIAIFLGYMIGNLHPSMGCGPFRHYSRPDYVMFDVITNEVNSWPEGPQKFIKYFGTVGFFLPAFLILLLAIYYYWAMAAGYKRMEQLLKMQLKSEAHDKQYLLARVDEIIKKGHFLRPDLML